MKCVTLQRVVNDTPEWLITNGICMGRWTRVFGVNCLADTVYCKAFVANTHIEHPDAKLHVFEITEIT